MTANIAPTHTLDQAQLQALHDGALDLDGGQVGTAHAWAPGVGAPPVRPMAFAMASSCSFFGVLMSRS